MSITIRSAQTISNGLTLKGSHDLYDGIILWLDASNPASYPGSGTTWYDLSPNHYDATLHNGASFSTNNINFDYTQSQYADIAPANMFNGDFTAIGWVYIRSFASWSRLFDFGNGSGEDNVLIAITNGSTGYPVLYANASNVFSSVLMPLNQWVQLAATQSGTTQTLYLNGQQVAQQAGGPEDNVTRNLNYIGRSNWGSDAYLDGKISSLKIWNRSLSVDEITTDYTINRPLTVLTLVVDLYGYLRTNGYAGYSVGPHPEVNNIPSGARVTSNITGFGTRTVTSVGVSTGFYFVYFDGSGLSDYASLSDTYTFTW